MVLTIKYYICKTCRSGEDICQEIITISDENKRKTTSKLKMVINAIKEVDEFIQRNQDMQERLKKNAELCSSSQCSDSSPSRSVLSMN